MYSLKVPWPFWPMKHQGEEGGVKKSFANRWLLVCLYNGPSLRPTMVSMANDIEMIKMREE